MGLADMNGSLIHQCPRSMNLVSMYRNIQAEVEFSGQTNESISDNECKIPKTIGSRQKACVLLLIKSDRC